MLPLKIQTLIDKYGEDVTRSYLQQRWAQPEHFWEFAGMFHHLMGDKVPEFHAEMVEMVMPVGKYGIGAPRGFAKSTVIGLIYILWVGLNGFKWFIPYISDTHLQAKLIAGGAKAEIDTNELLKFVYPDARSNRWGEEGFVINGLLHKCYILPLGAGMKIRGLKYENHRPDLVIIDDLENLELVYSKDRRAKLQKWFDYDLEPAMDRYSKHIIYIGTILHYSSLLKMVLENQGKYTGWKTKKYKALQDDGTSLWEARFDANYLKEIRDNPTHPDYVGSIVFAQELQNEPQDDQDRIIKLAWIKEYVLREKWVGFEAIDDEARMWKWLNTLERIGGVDPAISESETADYFSFYIMGFEQSTANEYMLDLKHDRIGDINEQVKLIVDGIVQWQLQAVGIESVAFQKGLYTLVKKELNRRAIYNCKIIPIQTDKDKIRRARIHSSAFEGGFIHLRNDHPHYATIKGEIEEFPLGAKDDAFDSLMLARETRIKPKSRTFARNPLNR
jgi:predicted phage terminase large subunit-like protein